MIPPLSISTIKLFEQCPWRFYREKIKKDVKDVKDDIHPTTLWGQRAHKALELYLRDGTPLPNEMSQLQGYADLLKKAEGSMAVEVKLAMTEDGEFAKFFDNDAAFYRGVVDLLKINGDKALVIDHKFGKVRVTDQLYMCALLVFVNYPSVKHVKAAFVWPTIPHRVVKEISPDVARAVDEQKFRPVREQIIRAMDDDKWPKRPSGLCGYCPVKDCEFNR